MYTMWEWVRGGNFFLKINTGVGSGQMLVSARRVLSKAGQIFWAQDRF